MLNIIKGASGTGKSTYLVNILCEMVENGEENILFIVPDQSSFQWEKAFLEKLGPCNSLKIKVLGFNRLCDYIFSVNGSDGKQSLDDGGKAIIMSLAIDECIDNIPLYAKTKNKNELIGLMLSAVSEYKKCSISSENLIETAKIIENETLSAKLNETALIRDTFDALVNESYVDPDDYIKKGYNSLKKNNIFKNYVVAVDSFSGFTMVELELLEKLMTDSKEFYIALNNDNTNNKELFYTTNRTINQLKRIAKNNNVKIAPNTVMEDFPRYENPCIVPLIKNIYRIEKEVIKEKPHNIYIQKCSNRYNECEYVARNIRKLVIEKGLKYDDIAVVYRENNFYDGVIDTIFDKFEIPYFMDKAYDIFTKPLMKLVSSIFEAINTSLSRESILNILKSGLLPYSNEDISMFENYLYIWDIKGSDFKAEFTDNPRGLVPEFKESDIKNLENINKIRGGIIAPLLTFISKSKNTDGETITKNLYNLLVDYCVADNIIKMCVTLEENGELDLSSEQRRLWEILMNILDKMINILGKKKLSIKRYSELLMLQFNNSNIGYIPQGMDEVVISGIERVRLTEKKAVFVMGCNEGVFPRVPTSNGVFTDSERQILISCGIEINDSLEELNYKEMYLAYYALTLTSNILFVTYYSSNLKGEASINSSIVRELLEIYPNVDYREDSYVSTYDRLWCKNSAFEYLAENIKSNSKTVNKLQEYFSDKEIYSNKIDVIRNQLKDNPFRINDKTLSHNLFGKDLVLSASQVETYHLCKFKYFCQYGLNAKERKTAKIDSLQYGTLIHYLLERFLKENPKEKYVKYTEKDITEIVSKMMTGYANDEIGGIDNKPPRFKYLFYRIKYNAVKLLLHIIEELAQSDFVPTDFELNIGDTIKPYKIALDDDSTISIKGFVDRVDVMSCNGEKYVRIVDYKTGTKEFKISDILYGLNLQMLIYMSAIKSNGEEYFGGNIVPSGVLYQPSTVKHSAENSLSNSEKANENINKSLRMNGIVLDNDSVIYGMDKSKAGMYIPVKVGNNGYSYGKDNIFNIVEMGKIFKNIDKLLTEMAETLHKGEIEYNPATEKYNACQWCPYISVCGYEEGKNSRKILSLNKDAVMKELSKEEEDNA